MSSIYDSLQKISINRSKMGPEKNFLSNIKFWRNRLKYDTWFVLSFFALLGVFWSISIFVILGIELYLKSPRLMSDLIMIGTSVFALTMMKKIPKSFQEVIVSNKSIFSKNIEDSKGTEDVYYRFIDHVKRTLGSKTEFIIPIILSVIYVSVSFLLITLPEISTRNIIVGSTVVVIEDELFLIYLFNSIISMAWMFIWVLIVGSALITIINTFRCLNKLGTDEFQLHVSYEDLKLGGFEEIGKFIISISIPSIVLSTFFSIIGLYMISADDFVGGYAFMAVSIVITSIFSILLYKNTTHIHDAISRYKFNLKYSLLTEIQETSKDKEVNRKTRYMIIYNIHNFYEKIEEINDWPFNPASIKKLLIILGSSVVPFLLSFIGL